MNVSHALIVANGTSPPPELLERLRAEADLFIAADGAANALHAAGIVPDVLLGDFDSITDAVREHLADRAYVHALDQEASDLDKAIAYAIGRGAQRITVTGAAGGRIDHMLTHISLLLKYHPRPILRLVDEDAEICTIGIEPVDIHGAPGDTLSLIAFGSVHGVTAEGVLYPLLQETLEPGSRGLSNRLVGDTARIHVAAGILVACHLRSQRLSR